MSRGTRSPIKNLPVRLPGQSIDEQIQDVADRRIVEPALLALMLCAVAFIEWWGYLFRLPRQPVVYTVLAIGGLFWAWYRIAAAFRQLRDLRLGRLGERAVGQYLDEVMRPLGCHVLHDIPCNGFNIDHAIVGPTGVFSIETKTRSKPVGRDATVHYDGQKVTVDGMAPDRDPIAQARNSARWLSDLLAESAGKKFDVRPVVLFPGWFVDPMPASAEVWVLNEKALPTFIRNAKCRLPKDDVSLIVFHLKRFVIHENQSRRGGIAPSR